LIGYFQVSLPWQAVINPPTHLFGDEGVVIKTRAIHREALQGPQFRAHLYTEHNSLKEHTHQQVGCEMTRPHHPFSDNTTCY